MMERPVGGDELMVQDTRGKKLPVEAQTKIEGRRGQNWTNCEVEALIALRGEMHEEFERNKQKQGMLTYFTTVFCTVSLATRYELRCVGFLVL